MSCEIQSSKAPKSDFQTTDQSEIFFQNVRAIYYHRRIIPEAKVHIYTLKSTPKDINFTLSLIHNWKSDQAYLMFDHAVSELPYTFLIGINQTYDTLVYTGESMSENTKICLQIGAAMQKSDSIYLMNHEINQSLFFETQESQKAFLTLYKDYMRLVE